MIVWLITPIQSHHKIMVKSCLSSDIHRMNSSYSQYEFHTHSRMLHIVIHKGDVGDINDSLTDNRAIHCRSINDRTWLITDCNQEVTIAVIPVAVVLQCSPGADVIVTLRTLKTHCQDECTRLSRGVTKNQKVILHHNFTSHYQQDCYNHWCCWAYPRPQSSLLILATKSISIKAINALGINNR